jgi:hypothetical protein
MLDQIVHDALRLSLQGESMRKLTSQLQSLRMGTAPARRDRLRFYDRRSQL